MEAVSVACRQQGLDRLVRIIGAAARGRLMDSERVGRHVNWLLVQEAVEQRAARGDRGLNHDDPPGCRTRSASQKNKSGYSTWCKTSTITTFDRAPSANGKRCAS